jgi:SAM-dependent methyltransferase
MKRRALDWIACPACREPLRLHVFAEEDAPPPPPSPGEARCAAHGGHATTGGGPPCAVCAGAEVLEGLLACGCGRVYPITGGIPRLLLDAAREFPEFYSRHRQALEGLAAAGLTPPLPRADRRSAESFGLQWSIYRDGDRTWFKDDAGLRKAELLYNLQATAEELAGKSLLDAGCGNGELTRAMAEYGLEVVAMDLSRSVEGARRRLRERGGAGAAAEDGAPNGIADRVHYVQASVLEPPLRPASFDFVHSSGVLHHTPSTHRAFRAIAPLVKPGGTMYVQVYRRRELWVHVVNVALRAVTRRLPLELLYRLCFLAAPLHAALSRLVHRLRGEGPPPASTRRERAVQMFDNYSPTYQYRHTVPELAALFHSAGFDEVREVTLDNERRHMLALVGTRPAAAPAAEARRSGNPSRSRPAPLLAAG